MAASMCDIQRRQANDGTSLGVFRPKRVLDLIIRRADVRAGKAEIARAWAAQGSLLDDLDGDEKARQLDALELIPWTFRLRYECDDPTCTTTHQQSIVDWEIAEFYRRVRHDEDWQDQVRAKWVEEVCGPDKDTALFVGNQHQHPTSFLVLGIWWPPLRPEQLTLAA